MRACLEHYARQGVYCYLIDNESTDSTVKIAREFLGKNLIGIESMARQGRYQWGKILRRKEALADRLDADWFIHADPDEIRVAPSPDQTLLEAIQAVDAEGYNAVNFMEYTFVPVRESPNHDHAQFQHTMRWYYPFGPRHPHRLNAWKKQPRRWAGIKKFAHELMRNRRMGPASIDLQSSGGHVLSFPGIKPYPVDFKLKHYIVLSLDHAIQKYVKKTFEPKEVLGMHGWRATATAYDFLLPAQAQMRPFLSDAELDPSDPLTEHLIVQQA